jgi:tetratricopeptide (TPR) repeat protein
MDTNEIRLEALDLNQQGALLLKNGNITEAQAKFDKAIELDPMVMESYKNYGDLCMETQKYSDAKNYYKKALLIDKRGELYFLYGNACFMNDNPHEGIENYNLAITNGYDSEDMMFFMGMAYEHLNDDQMALRYIQKACMKNPSRPDFKIKKISVMLRLNMLENAEETVDELLKDSPELFDGYHIKTQLLLSKGKLEDAELFAKNACDRFPDDADLMYDYIRCITAAQRLDEALNLIQKAKKMEYFEQSKRNFILLEAQIAAEKGDMQAAVNGCNECKALENGAYFDGEARFMLMNLYLAEKTFDKASEEAGQLIDKELEDNYYYAALYYRAFCMQQMGKTEQAASLFKEAASIYRVVTLKRPEAVDIYLYRAMCMRDLNDNNKALELLDFVENIAGEVAEIHTLRADIYKKIGKMALSNEELEKAFAIKPELKSGYAKEE